MSRHIDSGQQFVLQGHVETLSRECRDLLELGQLREHKVGILSWVERILDGLEIGLQSGVLLGVRFDEGLLVDEEFPHIRVVLERF